MPWMDTTIVSNEHLWTISLDQKRREHIRVAGPFGGLGQVYSAEHQRWRNTSLNRAPFESVGCTGLWYILIHHATIVCGDRRL